MRGPTLFALMYLALACGCGDNGPTPKPERPKPAVAPTSEPEAPPVPSTKDESAQRDPDGRAATASLGDVYGESQAAVSDPISKRMLAQWMEQRVASFDADGKRSSHRILRVTESPNAVFVLLSERIDGSGGCKEGLIALREDDLWLVPAQPVKLALRTIGYDCCPGQPCGDRSPTSWMLHLDKVLRTRDDDALSALVHPHEGMSATVEYILEDGYRHRVKNETNAENAPDMIFGLVNPFVAPHSEKNIICPDKIEGDHFVCHSGATAKAGRYKWRVDDKRVYLMEIEERSL